MDKYLLLLLKDVNTIIIPELGALTITNKTTGEIMFMPYLKYDDSKLASYIAEKEGWELNDAKNLISKYVREVLAVLDRGESYDMYQFGSFAKDKNGEVIFMNWDGSLPSERIEPENTSEIVLDHSKEITTEQTEEITSEEPFVNETINTPSSNTELKIEVGKDFILEIQDNGNTEIIKKTGDEIVNSNTDITPQKKIEIEIETKADSSETVSSQTENNESLDVTDNKEVAVETESPAPPVSKPVLSPEEEAEKQRIKAEKEAERERRLAERMEKRAMKDLPEENSVPEVEIKANEQDIKIEDPKKQTAKKTKVDENVATQKDAPLAIKRTQNQRNSIFIAATIIVIGVAGGLFFIFSGEGEITNSFKASNGKELAENNKNVNQEQEEKNQEEVIENAEVIEEQVSETTTTTEETIPEENDAAEVKAATKPITPKAKPAPTPTPTPPPAPVATSSGKYHVIGGSFSSEGNASRFAESMQAKGISASLLGKIGKMYVVSVGSYSSKSEAQQAIKSGSVKGWVFMSKR